jgi:hypothetical protein
MRSQNRQAPPVRGDGRRAGRIVCAADGDVMASKRNPLGDPMTLGNMRRLGLALIISLAPFAEATADVLTFACPGTIRKSSAGGSRHGRSRSFWIPKSWL